MLGLRQYAPLWAVPVLLVIFPWVVDSSYIIGLMTEMLVYGIFAMSLDLLLGYTGLVPLGHAAFFGIGGYTAGWLALKLGMPVFVTLPAAVVLSALVALIVGFFCLRTSGIYFLMLTLAFSQVLYAIVHSWKSVTGGSDGLAGIPRPVYLSDEIDPSVIDALEKIGLEPNLRLYYTILVVFLVAFFLLRRAVRSPFGHVLIGIRENESRIRAIGYDTRVYKLVCFVLAGSMAGLAGGLYAYFNGYMSPHELSWAMSGQVMVMSIIGGAGTLVGPILGSSVVLLIQNLVSSYTDRWPLIMGALFMFTVLVARNGITGIYDQVMAKLSSKPERGSARGAQARGTP